VSNIVVKSPMQYLDKATGTLRDLGDLQRLGILANRAAPFILLNGKSPVQQLRLF